MGVKVETERHSLLYDFKVRKMLEQGPPMEISSRYLIQRGEERCWVIGKRVRQKRRGSPCWTPSAEEITRDVKEQSRSKNQRKNIWSKRMSCLKYSVSADGIKGIGKIKLYKSMVRGHGGEKDRAA